ncbi:hypothetical protein [Plantactinospora soyae]|uniref:Uncharacterized protein n=1 Tax=Plantactinospora soyae TaxID=1544732 RepID=A0A927LZR3_9ACTN|nr:hypothetical protein [Plantactinospora soyae]MBE1485523.1 hypothetical protein [Plantactinospora soyae]
MDVPEASSAAGQRMQVQFDAVDAAARALPNQVAALGQTRQTLTARSVPAEWLGQVPGSQTAATGHAGNIAESVRQLTAAGGRLDNIIGGMQATSTGTRAFDDAKTKKQQEQNQQLAQVEYPPGQRDKALAVLKEIEAKNPISVAAVARNQLEEVMWLRNFESGQIGDHYDKDVRELLGKPPTDANLLELARTETEFWYSGRGSYLGMTMGPDWRYGYLLSSRADWLTELTPALREDAQHRIFPMSP